MSRSTVEPSPPDGLSPESLLSLLSGPRTRGAHGHGMGAHRFGSGSHLRGGLASEGLRLVPTDRLGVELAPGELDRFYPLLRFAGEESLDAYLDRLLRRGISETRILLELLHPAAVRLGEEWENDLCTFLDVTVGSGRLQRLVRRLTARTPPAPSGTPAGERPRILLSAAAPGQQHTLGLVMVAELFRKSSWEVEVGPPLHPEPASDRVAREFFHAVGISIPLLEEAPRVREEIRRIRRRSMNPAIGILVGGIALSARPEVVDEVGADAAAPDAHLAPDVARAFL